MSFRDPAGYVCRDGNRIFRAVQGFARRTTEELLASNWLRAHIAAGNIPESRWIDEGPRDQPPLIDGRWMEHACLAFPAYPPEISALQLFDSARLTLRLATDALEHDWLLKDASAWNVLFDVGRPIFCDLLSFEPWVPSPYWQAYAQFQRCFVIPLLLYKVCGIPPRGWFLTHRDGVAPEIARGMIRGRAAWRQPGLEAVTLPALFARRGARSRTKTQQPQRSWDKEAAKHALGALLMRLTKHIEKVRPTAAPSAWTGYEHARNHYGAADLQQKESFIRQALSAEVIRNVIDLGCNTGEYSRLASALGKTVVAVDSDDESVQRLYAQQSESGAPISPFALDIARPTPALGWMNSEVPAFIDRANKKFDCVLALGLLHHLIIRERAPIALVAELLAHLTTHSVVIEWVDREDPMFRELAGANLPLYAGLHRGSFENSLSVYFNLQAKLELPCGTRTLYCWHLKNAPSAT
jgi:SAM-dependent methyltransferase